MSSSITFIYKVRLNSIHVAKRHGYTKGWDENMNTYNHVRLPTNKEFLTRHIDTK